MKRAGEARQTEERLIFDDVSYLWSNIEHITLKRSQLGNRYLAIYFRDDRPPASCDIDLMTEEKDVTEFINQLQEKAARMQFTFASEVDTEPLKKGEPAISVAEPSPEKPIEISEQQKVYAMIILGIVFFVGIYIVFGMEIAISIFAVVLVHEAGHFVALKSFHMTAHGLFFIPFIGAGVAPKEDFPSLRAEAVVSLAGPVAGLFLTLVMYLVKITSTGGFPSDESFFPALIGSILLVNVIINLLNLMPILPLDGGTIVRIAMDSRYRSVLVCCCCLFVEDMKAI
ncbi:MAG: hypothetical protein HXS46_01210 [Theionarchaea archaeon]|nr:hypothetical protein [Theionarchaea archaeon]